MGAESSETEIPEAPNEEELDAADDELSFADDKSPAADDELFSEDDETFASEEELLSRADEADTTSTETVHTATMRMEESSTAKENDEAPLSGTTVCGKSSSPISGLIGSESSVKKSLAQGAASTDFTTSESRRFSFERIRTVLSAESSSHFTSANSMPSSAKIATSGWEASSPQAPKKIVARNPKSPTIRILRILPPR